MSLLPHCDFLRKLRSSVGFTDKSGLLFEDLQSLLLAEIFLLIVHHLQSVLSFMYLVELVGDGTALATQRQAQFWVRRLLLLLCLLCQALILHPTRAGLGAGKRRQ